MIVNFSCLKLGIGEKLFMLDLGQNDLFAKKLKIMGRKGCILKYCKTQILVGNNPQKPSISLCFHFLKKNEWNEIKQNVNPYKNKVYPNIVMYIAALLKTK